MINSVELRTDGWWILFHGGEEAGPFVSMEVAEAFLDHLESLQRSSEAEETKPSDADLSNRFLEGF